VPDQARRHLSGTTHTRACEGESVDYYVTLIVRILTKHCVHEHDSKNVRYQAQVVHASIVDSAAAAADAYDEAMQAKIQREQLIRSSKKNPSSTQLIKSPRALTTAMEDSQSLSSSGSYLYDTSAHLYRQLFADKLPAQGWLVSAPMNVAGKLASRLFGTPQADDQPEDAPSNALGSGDEELRSYTDGREAKSLLEELNGLNMQLLERLVRDILWAMVTVVADHNARNRRVAKTKSPT
jgi:hypothetical protein